MTTLAPLPVDCAPRRCITYQRSDISGKDAQRVNEVMEKLCAARDIEIGQRQRVHYSGDGDPAVELWHAATECGADTVVIPDRSHLSDEEFELTSILLNVVTADTNPCQLWVHGRQVPWT